MACIIELDGAMKLVYYRGEKDFYIHQNIVLHYALDTCE